MDTTVNNYPERFLTYLEVEKNCSQHTIESYQKDLAAFAEFMLRRNKQNFFLAADRSFGCAWLSRRA